MRPPTLPLLLALVLVGSTDVTGRLSAVAADTAGDEDGDVSLADRLKVGLKARRPEEEEFLEKVATLVLTGKLPRKLVDSTYIWAIRRRQDYPFPAFERALQLQADRLGVDL